MKKSMLLFLLLTTQTLFAQVEFITKVNKNQLGINECFRVEFSMNKEGGNFIPPSFEDFDLIREDKKTIHHSIDGRESYSTKYTYLLSPQKKGTFSIGSASVTVNKKEYKTEPVIIKITKKTPLSESFLKRIEVVTEYNKEPPYYVGEKIIVTYKVYTPTSIDFHRFKVIKRPKIRRVTSNFSNMDKFRVLKEKHNGFLCNMIVFEELILHPKKRKKIKIKPLILELVIEDDLRRKRMISKTIFKEPLRLKVKSKKKIIKIKKKG